MLIRRRPIPKRGKRSLRESKVTPEIESKLQRFWAQIAAGRRALPLLIAYAKIEGKKTHSRYNFDRIKHRFKIAGEQCLVCEQPATVRHHILALSLGGPNTKANIAPLCDEHHAIIHPHLAERHGQR